jgi:hypothetical protein
MKLIKRHNKKYCDFDIEEYIDIDEQYISDLDRIRRRKRIE